MKYIKTHQIPGASISVDKINMPHNQLLEKKDLRCEAEKNKHPSPDEKKEIVICSSATIMATSQHNISAHAIKKEKPGLPETKSLLPVKNQRYYSSAAIIPALLDRHGRSFDKEKEKVCARSQLILFKENNQLHIKVEKTIVSQEIIKNIAEIGSYYPRTTEHLFEFLKKTSEKRKEFMDFLKEILRSLSIESRSKVRSAADRLFIESIYNRFAILEEAVEFASSQGTEKNLRFLSCAMKACQEVGVSKTAPLYIYLSRKSAETKSKGNLIAQDRPTPPSIQPISKNHLLSRLSWFVNPEVISVGGSFDKKKSVLVKSEFLQSLTKGT